jgi:hypothetical protein
MTEINGNTLEQHKTPQWTKEEEMDAADGLTIHKLFNQGIGLTYNDFSKFTKISCQYYSGFSPHLQTYSRITLTSQ